MSSLIANNLVTRPSRRAIAPIAGALAVALLFLFLSASTVQAGYVGVVLTFGRVQPGVLSPGFHFVVLGAQRIVQIDTRLLPHAFKEIDAASKELQSVKDRSDGQSGLVNVLYQSDLHVESVTLVEGTATIRLQGQLLLGGKCDHPRVAAQLEAMSRQFASVKSVGTFLSGPSSMGGRSSRGCRSDWRSRRAGDRVGRHKMELGGSSRYAVTQRLPSATSGATLRAQHEVRHRASPPGAGGIAVRRRVRTLPRDRGRGRRWGPVPRRKKRGRRC